MCGGAAAAGVRRSSRQRTATSTVVAAEEEGGPARRRRSHVVGTLRSRTETRELCLVYARTNPSICASFLPRMATTSSQGRSRRLPPHLPSPSSLVAVAASLARIFRARRIPPRARDERRPGCAAAASAFDRSPHVTVMLIGRLGGLGSFNSTSTMLTTDRSTTNAPVSNARRAVRRNDQLTLIRRSRD